MKTIKGISSNISFNFSSDSPRIFFFFFFW
jgi:hypothetical protein